MFDAFPLIAKLVPSDILHIFWDSVTPFVPIIGTIFAVVVIKKFMDWV